MVVVKVCIGRDYFVTATVPPDDKPVIKDTIRFNNLKLTKISIPESRCGKVVEH